LRCVELNEWHFKINDFKTRFITFKEMKV
jgi:hypothetical protein